MRERIYTNKSYLIARIPVHKIVLSGILESEVPAAADIRRPFWCASILHAYCYLALGCSVEHHHIRESWHNQRHRVNFSVINRQQLSRLYRTVNGNVKTN